MSERLEIVESGGGPRHRLSRLRGTLDASGAAALDDHARAALGAGVHLVLNLAEVSFVSSAGVGVLLALSEDFGERGLSLRLSTPSREVTAPIELLCLDRFLTLCASDDEACAEWAA